MIVLFARANHPAGWGGYARVGNAGQGVSTGAHGYVIVGVVCNSLSEVERARRHVDRNGFNPRRNSDPWFGGEGFDWDYLTTLSSGEDIDRRSSGDVGDNRYFKIYGDLKEFLHEA